MFGLKYKKRIEELESENAELRAALFRVEKKIKLLENPPPPPKVWHRGDRVKGSKTCGFHASMTGVVTYVEENISGRIWVRRDGASSDVYYMSHELEAI